MSADPRFDRAIALIDAANARDPREAIGADGKPCPRELLYARRMTEMVERFAPQASDAVKLAVRAQHVERWRTPRESYPMDRNGYLQWRTNLYAFHAETTGRLMQQAGYDIETIERVKKAIGKRGRKVNPDAQLVEDVASLVFIEHYLLQFAGQKPDYSEEKWLDIIAKTWNKMSAAAQVFAVSGKLALPQPLVPLIGKAIAHA